MQINQQLHQALAELYSGSNQKDAFKLKQAEQILLEFQKSSGAFITALELLSSTVEYTMQEQMITFKFF